MKEMCLNTKLEIAVEILATKISNTLEKGYNEDSSEIKELIQERDEMYKGNLSIIEKIITKYAEDIKNDIN